MEIHTGKTISHTLAIGPDRNIIWTSMQNLINTWSHQHSKTCSKPYSLIAYKNGFTQNKHSVCTFMCALC